MTNIAIFASGTGSNFDAIANSIENGALDATISLLVCDQKNAPVIGKAQKKGIPTFVFTAKEFQGKAAYEEAVIQAVKKYQADWLILAGYMRLLGKTMLKAFPNKIINIHPSLLPAYKGIDAIERAFEAREKMMGVSIHFVDEGMDTGKLIAQERIELTGGETLDDIKTKIHQVEHQLYPQTLTKLFKKS